ncbi:MAG: class I SAM-dependent methyltransferase [Thermodesulfobacteriota bacterium]
MMSEYSSLFFIPERNHIPLKAEDLRQWYHNLILEVEKANYHSDKLLLLEDKRNYYGKYLSADTREFFLNHFGRNLAEAVNFYFKDKEKIKYLEIGSGCGNQLLLMALLGAEVVGYDIRQDVSDLVKRRKDFYEGVSRRKLNISLLCEDIFKIDLDSREKFDAINFLFSFNDLKANEKMLELVNHLIKPGGRLVIQDTNPTNYYNQLFRRRGALPPGKVVKILKSYGFKIHSLRGGYVLPPIFWLLLSIKILAPIDQFLCRSLFLSVSYRLMAEK